MSDLPKPKCPGGFMGRPPGGEHFWSEPTANGHQECLWCRERRQLRVVPMEESLKRQVETAQTFKR